MAWTALSKDKHKEMVLKRPVNFEYLRSQIFASICNYELASCATWLPIVFIKDNGKISPFALMGLEHRKNLLVNAKGQWTNSFFPSVFASHPFRIGKERKEDEQSVIVFFDDNRVIRSDGDGERLFNEDGSETHILKHYIELLAKMESSRQQLDVSCSILENSSVLEPFEVEIVSDGEAKPKLEGLLRVNPEKFKALDDKQFIEMRKTNTLDLIYAHFFSMGGLERLGRIRKLSGKVGSSLGELGAKIFEQDKQDLKFDLN
jgi:hypothetical protein